MVNFSFRRDIYTLKLGLLLENRFCEESSNVSRSLLFPLRLSQTLHLLAHPPNKQCFSYSFKRCRFTQLFRFFQCNIHNFLCYITIHLSKNLFQYARRFIAWCSFLFYIPDIIKLLLISLISPKPSGVILHALLYHTDIRCRW